MQTQRDGRRQNAVAEVEAVATVLGHSRTDTSEIHALRNTELAAEVAKAIR